METLETAAVPSIILKKALCLMMRAAKILVYVFVLVAGLTWCYVYYGNQGYRLYLGREPHASGETAALGPPVLEKSAFPPGTGGTLFWFRDAAAWKAFRAKNIGEAVPKIDFSRQTVVAVFHSGRNRFEEVGAMAEGPEFRMAFREVVSLSHNLMSMIPHCAYTGRVRVYVLDRVPERIVVHINRWEFDGLVWHFSLTKIDPLLNPGVKPVS